MAQRTTSLSQAAVVASVDQFTYGIGATDLPMGTFCMTDTNGLAVPLVDTVLEGGTGFFLGYAAANYKASTTSPDGFLFIRGTRAYVPLAKSGDVPVAYGSAGCSIGQAVSLQQNDTIKKTFAANGVSCILLQIPPTGGYIVQLP